MRTLSTLSFLFSALLHIGVILVMLFGIIDPFRKVDVTDNCLVVEFAQIAPQTASPIFAPPAEKGKAQKKPNLEPTEQKTAAGDEQKEMEKEQKKEEQAKEQKQKEDLAEELLRIQKNKLKKELDKKLKEEKKKEIEKKKTKPKEVAKEVTKKTDKVEGKKRAQMNLEHKDKKDQKGQKKKSLDDLFDDMDSKEDDKSSKAGGQESKNIGPTFTASEIAILKSHISRCWNIHAGAKGAKEHVVDVKIHINPDGTVQSAEIVDKARMKADPFYKVAAEAAQRSVLDPDCNPLPIPSSSYEKWKNITFRFDPKEMF